MVNEQIYGELKMQVAQTMVGRCRSTALKPRFVRQMPPA